MIPGITCRTVRQLLDVCGTPEDVLSLGLGDLRQIFGKREDIISAITGKSTFARAEQELRYAEQHHIKILFYTDSEYPQRLNQPDCEDTPPLLYFRGTADLNAPRVVSVVGSRQATEYGKELTRRLVDGFRHEDVTVVSGLAYGIDTSSHTAAVSNGLPTVGVVAHGLDTVYPSQNRHLAEDMVNTGGGIITEYPSFTNILPAYFPARNRIIAALSDVVVVAEAAKTGGALITANLAIGYHREVLAFPGRVGDKYSEGCNRIIANSKARLITCADDLFEAMNWDRRHATQPRQQTLALDLAPDETVVYNLLAERKELSIDEINQLCDLTMPKVASALLSLELKNICRCLPGKRYRLN